ncbi:uncharacterized protein LOC107757580 [Sinocyclocheilus rhinocerous]|uniref:uncharacterized protein LOC107757580 n=1 Tax=Sinocyclocheilus rhinocerous TaxID=307959 RepID=UPI0007B8216F|nr:PREDICTED: uncharacterized protein LOC107757580 [Sinocyclocheilus rhinocerous]
MKEPGSDTRSSRMSSYMRSPELVFTSMLGDQSTERLVCLVEGIRLQLRDRDLLKKRKAEAEEKATNQWVYGAHGLKRVKKRSSGTPGRKGAAVDVPEDQAQESDPCSVTLPDLPTIAEPLPVETQSEDPLQGFLIEDLGPEEEEDMPQKSLVIDAGAVDDAPESKLDAGESSSSSSTTQSTGEFHDLSRFSTEECIVTNSFTISKDF